MAEVVPPQGSTTVAVGLTDRTGTTAQGPTAVRPAVTRDPAARPTAEYRPRVTRGL